MTRKFLQRRQQMKEQGAKAKKEVDRRASKNRKIRYVVHDKILNFLNPQQNLQAVEGRQALVANLFGAKKAQNEAEIQLTGKKRKAKKATFATAEDEDDIALI